MNHPSPGSPDRSEPARPDDDRPGCAGRLLSWIVIIALAATVWVRLHPRDKTAGSDGTATSSGKPHKVKAKHVIPVVVAQVRRGDMHLYIDGLGTVTPFYTVTVRARVDGLLMKLHYREGQTVREGDLLAEIDPRPFEVQVAQAAGTLAKDQALLKNAQVDLVRFRKLPVKFIPEQQATTQEALVDQYRAAIMVDQAQLDNAKLQLIYSRITAPIAGQIGLRLVDQGNMIRSSEGAGLAVITQIQPIAVVFSIAQDHISRVRARMRADPELVVEAYDSDLKNRLSTGKLIALDNQVDPATGTVKLKASFENADGALFPNQFVNARLHIDVRRQALIVPTAAVQRGPDFAYCYLAKNGLAELKKIVPGAVEGEQTVIESGLEVGESVVTAGVDRIVQGTHVAPQSQPSNQTAPGAKGDRPDARTAGSPRPGSVPASAAAPFAPGSPANPPQGQVGPR
ncbi:MAG: MdtA/MuxA family multidrug efflux RND transporter periplasmic adaptor subunit [Candidatus Riflebacteria bacterium]|nr:MdtA/MuxA family multidrug efflux RND transporter periplasmic adaptor subunit [Candidatus Riflebacteria bacterium]